MSSELVSRLGEAARERTRVVVVMHDGTRCAGRVAVTGITFAMVACSDGEERRVELGEVVRIITAEGERLWPPAPTREA
jgi:hypothetical protein